MITVNQLTDQPDDLLIALRNELWWGRTPEQHRTELIQLLERAGDRAVFIAVNENGELAGMAELALRKDYVNGCAFSPVVFLEGIFVQDSFRRQGVARRLCEACEQWGKAHGAKEFASDVDIENQRSMDMHLSLGFEEVERVVCFKKVLSSATSAS